MGIKEYTIARRRMVDEQLQGRGIRSRSLLRAFLRVPRHLFVDPAVAGRAYEDCSFPIGYSQTISQPYTIALMVEALGITRRHRVLEIGTGSGYQTAILSLIAKEVYSIERIASLSQLAERTLKRVERGRIRLKVGDGSSGWRHYAPYDRIIVSAAMRGRPDNLFDQLCDRGVLIGPVNRGTERLVLFSKEGSRITERKLSACAFVPLKKGVV